MDKIKIVSIGCSNDPSFFLTPISFLWTDSRNLSSHLVVDSQGNSNNLFPNRFVPHDRLLQAVIYGMFSDSQDLVHPVILSKMGFDPQAEVMRSDRAQVLFGQLVLNPTIS